MKYLFNKIALLTFILSTVVAFNANSSVRIIRTGNDNVTVQKTFRQVNSDEIQMQKIAFYTQELQLTTDEAQKFWPLYNEYWDACVRARAKTMNSLRALNKASSQESSASNQEIEKLTEEYLQNFKVESELPAQYFERFKSILPIKKAARIFHVEEKFRRVLIKQFRNAPSHKNETK